MDIINLEPNIDYTLYFCAGSTQPGYPDLMANEDVTTLAFKTEAIPGIFTLRY